MAKVFFGNHSSVMVPRQDRDNIRKFYRDVLGGNITKVDPERDFLRLGEDFYIAFLYGDVPDESEFLRSFRSVWLEIKSDNVEETSRNILDSGLVRKLDVPDSHLYFQAPGGQCLRLVGINEDLSFYEGAGDGPDVAKVKEAQRTDFQERQHLTGKDLSMKQQDYSSTITAKVTPEQAFERISRVADWWTKGFTGAAQKVGDAFTVRFGETFVDFEVSEVVPGKKVVWQVTDCNLHWINDKKEWKDTSVVWEASSDNGVTRVKMTHVGLVPGAECYDNCKGGWDFCVGKSLSKLLNENRGLPDQKPR